jgi:vanillate O-demethylase monooxygenase subunit
MPAHPNKHRRLEHAPFSTLYERYGWIWVLGQPTRDVPVFEEWDDPGFHKVFCGPYTANASGPRIIENFLDVAHFPFVHGGYLGDEDYPEIKDYEVERTTEGVVARTSRFISPMPMAQALAAM